MNEVVSTRSRKPDDAERLFGHHGIDGASLRTITSEADVTLAAVHYDLQLKEVLVQAGLERRPMPMNRNGSTGWMRLKPKRRRAQSGSPGSLEALIDLPPIELLERLHFVIGRMVRAMASHSILRAVSGLPESDGADALTTRMYSLNCRNADSVPYLSWLVDQPDLGLPRADTGTAVVIPTTSECAPQSGRS